MALFGDFLFFSFFFFFVFFARDLVAAGLPTQRPPPFSLRPSHARPPFSTTHHNSDIKPENILLLNEPPHAQGHGHALPAAAAASGPVLKLADLGSCRGMCSRPPYTEYISTRWYR